MVEANNNDSWKSLVLAGAIGGFLGTISLAFIFYAFILDFELLDTDFCEEKFDRILCFASTKWNEETYLTVISSFYETIIVVLLALLTAVAFFTFVIIRSETKDWVLVSVKDHVQVYFESSQHQSLIDDAWNKKADDLEARIERLED